MTTTTDIGTAPSARVLSARTRAAYASDWALFTCPLVRPRPAPAVRSAPPPADPAAPPVRQPAQRPRRPPGPLRGRERAGSGWWSTSMMEALRVAESNNGSQRLDFKLGRADGGALRDRTRFVRR